jgi:uncharacterized protein YwqG
MEEEIRSLIGNRELMRIAGDLMGLLRYAIRMKTRPADDESELALGTSKIGGLPDLPPQVDWPIWDEKPLPFLTQIHLRDVAPYDDADELPHTGMLYFFFNDEALETYPPTRGSWHVMYYDGDLSTLRRRRLSSQGQRIYPTCAVEFFTMLTLPPFESLFLQRLGLSYDAFQREAPIEQRREAEAFMELEKQLYALYDGSSPHHQLIGHPYQIQGDLLLECQRDTHYEGDPADWRLLLQIDSDSNAAMMWGDVGLLYFYIPHMALAARNFSQAHLIMQCS